MNNCQHASFSRRQNRNVPGGERGFVLLAVVLFLTVLAAIALALSNQGASQVSIAAGELQSDQLRYIAEAGLEHAKWQLEQSASCSAYSNVPATAFGAGTYSATVTPTSSSPVTLAAVGTLTNGAQRLLTRSDVTIYDSAAGATGTLIPENEGKDTFIQGETRRTNQNKGGDPELKTSAKIGKEKRTLLQFDLSGLPPTAKVLTATLDLYLQKLGSTDVVYAHVLLRDWTEDGVTWDSYDGTNPWTTSGGDYDPDVAVSFLADSVGAKTMDITDVAKAWVSGSLSNYGLLLRSSPAAGGKENKYHSSDKANVPRPRLILTYVCECGLVCPGITAGNSVILSTTTNAILGGLSFDTRDLAEYDPPTATATMFFDGGLATLNKDINAVHVLDNGHIVLSTKDNANLGSLSFKNSDLVEYDPDTGTATLFFDSGSTTLNKDIAAVQVLDSGNILLSTKDAASIGGVSFSNKDLVEYNPTSGSASIYFNGDATTLSKKITAVHVLENGHIVLGAEGNTTLGGLSFKAADLIEYDPATNTATMYFEGSALFSDAAEKISSVHIQGDSGPP